MSWAVPTENILSTFVCRAGTYTVAMAAWANAAGEAPSALLQQLAALARQDLLRFEVDAKPTLAFQVASCVDSRLTQHTHHA